MVITSYTILFHRYEVSFFRYLHLLHALT